MRPYLHAMEDDLTEVLQLSRIIVALDYSGPRDQRRFDLDTVHRYQRVVHLGNERTA